MNELAKKRLFNFFRNESSPSAREALSLLETDEDRRPGATISNIWFIRCLAFSGYTIMANLKTRNSVIYEKYNPSVEKINSIYKKISGELSSSQGCFSDETENLLRELPGALIGFSDYFHRRGLRAGAVCKRMEEFLALQGDVCWWKGKKHIVPNLKLRRSQESFNPKLKEWEWKRDENVLFEKGLRKFIRELQLVLEGRGYLKDPDTDRPSKDIHDVVLSLHGKSACRSERRIRPNFGDREPA